jgi:hypothetical protein
MMKQSESVVVGIFDHYRQAAAAIQDLWRAGFGQDQIEMITPAEQVREKGTTEAVMQKNAEDGAVRGALAGATLGAVAGALAMTLVPPLGLAVAGAVLTGAVGGAALGAAGGTFLGAFVAMGMSESRARQFSRAVEDGYTVVIVKDLDRRQEAREILARHGGREGPLMPSPSAAPVQ